MERIALRPSLSFLIVLPLLAAAVPAGAATRMIPVPTFDKLRVEGPYRVRVHTGGATSVKASGPAASLDRLLVETRGDMLVVSTEKKRSWRGTGWRKEDVVTIDISVPALESADLAGSGDMTIDEIRGAAFVAQLTGSGNLDVGRLDASRLKASVTGSGNLSLMGKADRADISVTGSGNLAASRLSVDLLNAAVLGSGNIDIGATLTARANVTGSGDITIAGRPNCTTSKNGSGNIRCGG